MSCHKWEMKTAPCIFQNMESYGNKILTSSKEYGKNIRNNKHTEVVFGYAYYDTNGERISKKSGITNE